MPRIITLTPNPTFDFACEADFVEANRKLRCYNPKSHPGGGGVNVARAASRLGGDVLAIFTAGGLYGEALKKLVEAENIATRIVPVSGDTRIAFHVRNHREENEYRFNLPGAELTADEAKALIDAVSTEAAAGDYVVGSGSLPPGAPPDLWARAARAAKEKNAYFVLDSISGVKEALREGLYMLRQNKHEYQALSGRDLAWPGEITDFAKEMIRKGGVERMVISHGGDGSVMATPDGVYRVKAMSVKADSAVGAGDSFVGAVVTALARGDDNDAALKLGMAAAAATRMSPGTALFDPADVTQLLSAYK